MVDGSPTPQVTPTRQVPCQKTDCDKVYKARGTMLNHMRKHHKEVESPLGTFPPSSTAVVLQFGDTEDASTQGNSHGAISSPKVASTATYVCAFCDIHFETKEDVTKHMGETHVNVDIVGQDVADDDDDATNKEAEAELEQEEDFMKAAKEELEVCETLTDLADNAFDPVTDKEKREAMKDKLHRYRNIMTKKDEILKAKIEEVKSLKHDVDMSKQVETHKESLVNEKENKLKAVSTQFKNLKKELKTVNSTNRKQAEEVKILRNERGELIKENNNLKTSLKEKEDLIVHLEEQIIPEEIVEVDPPRQNIQAMNKTSTSHTCAACEKSFGSNRALEKHM